MYVAHPNSTPEQGGGPGAWRGLIIASFPRMRGTLPRAANTEKRIADPFRLLRILGQNRLQPVSR